MTEKIVNAYPELCTGCKQCELFCSFQHESTYSPRLSRIKVVKFEDRCLSVPTTCAYCEKAVCEEVCPVGAMTHNHETGTAEVIEELCIGCKECSHVCPLGAVDMHPKKGIAMRCDLCGGDPLCVKYCPAGAIKYEPSEYLAKDRRRARVLAWNLDKSLGGER